MIPTSPATSKTRLASVSAWANRKTPDVKSIHHLMALTSSVPSCSLNSMVLTLKPSVGLSKSVSLILPSFGAVSSGLK